MPVQIQQKLSRAFLLVWSEALHGSRTELLMSNSPMVPPLVSITYERRTPSKTRAGKANRQRIDPNFAQEYDLQLVEHDHTGPVA